MQRELILIKFSRRNIKRNAYVAHSWRVFYLYTYMFAWMYRQNRKDFEISVLPSIFVFFFYCSFVFTYIANVFSSRITHLMNFYYFINLSDSTSIFGIVIMDHWFTGKSDRWSTTDESRSLRSRANSFHLGLRLCLTTDFAMKKGCVKSSSLLSVLL